jgi:DNA-binding NtrC family response regulator
MDQWSVLFLDDELNVLNALRRTLRRESYRTFFVDGPDEALEVLRDNQIDVVVSDHLMPAMDGLTFLNMVKDQYPHIIRVVLTGHADLQVAIKAINEGEVFRFLTKPWNDIELKITLQQIFDFLKLRRNNQLLLDAVKKQRAYIERMEDEHPGIFKVDRDESGSIVLEELGELLD